jgi:hypothetical protein
LFKYKNKMTTNHDNSTAHHSTVELANCRLYLRSDLSFHLQEYQGEPCYLIEDEFNSRFYRVGLAEGRFENGCPNGRPGDQRTRRHHNRKMAD